MPIYEFACQSCGERSSVFTKTFSVAAKTVCEHCGGGSLQRLISQVAVLRSPQDTYGDYDRSSWMRDLDDGDDDGDSTIADAPSWDF